MMHPGSVAPPCPVPVHVSLYDRTAGIENSPRLAQMWSTASPTPGPIHSMCILNIKWDTREKTHLFLANWGRSLGLYGLYQPIHSAMDSELLGAEDTGMLVPNKSAAELLLALKSETSGLLTHVRPKCVARPRIRQ